MHFGRHAQKNGLPQFAHNKQILTYCNRSLMKIDVHQGIPFLIWKTAFANSIACGSAAAAAADSLSYLVVP